MKKRDDLRPQKATVIIHVLRDFFFLLLVYILVFLSTTKETLYTITIENILKVIELKSTK